MIGQAPPKPLPCPFCHVDLGSYLTRDGEWFHRHPENGCYFQKSNVAPSEVALWNTRRSA